MKWFALDAAAMGDLDYSGADSAAPGRRRAGTTAGAGWSCARVDPAVRKLLDAYGLTEKIGAAYIFDTPQDVMAAYRKLTNAT